MIHRPYCCWPFTKQAMTIGMLLRERERHKSF